MAAQCCQEAWSGLSAEFPDVCHGHSCVTLHTAGPHLGLWLLPGSSPSVSQHVTTPGVSCYSTDQNTSLPNQLGTEVLPDVLPVYTSEIVSSHTS